MVVSSSVCSSESESFGIDLLVGLGLMAIEGFIVVGPTSSFSHFSGRVGRAVNCTPRWGRHYIAELETVGSIWFWSGGRSKWNTNLIGGKNGKVMQIVNCFAEFGLCGNSSSNSRCNCGAYVGGSYPGSCPSALPVAFLESIGGPRVIESKCCQYPGIACWKRVRYQNWYGFGLTSVMVVDAEQDVVRGRGFGYCFVDEMVEIAVRCDG